MLLVFNSATEQFIITIMKNKIIIAFLLAVASVCMSFTSSAPASNIEIAIIVNSENPVDKMNNELVKSFWLRRFVKRWKEINKGILPVDRKNKCAEQDIFYVSVLGLAPEVVEAYLSARQYQNGDSPIQKFMSDADIIEYVSREPGAIGYVNAASLGKGSGVRVIFTVSK